MRIGLRVPCGAHIDSHWGLVYSEIFDLVRRPTLAPAQLQRSLRGTWVTA